MSRNRPDLSEQMRDPMSKTLVIALLAVIALTLVAMTVVIGAIMKGNLGDGATIGLISTIVAGIANCVTAVASRGQVADVKPIIAEDKHEEP